MSLQNTIDMVKNALTSREWHYEFQMDEDGELGMFTCFIHDDFYGNSKCFFTVRDHWCTFDIYFVDYLNCPPDKLIELSRLLVDYNWFQFFYTWRLYKSDGSIRRSYTWYSNDGFNNDDVKDFLDWFDIGLEPDRDEFSTIKLMCTNSDNNQSNSGNSIKLDL